MSEHEPQEPGTAAAAPAQRAFLRELFDFQFRSFVTTRMLPSIFVIGVINAGVIAVYFTVLGFQASTGMGVAWVLLFGPVTFLGIVLALRVVLEVVLVLFKLTVQVETIQGMASRIEGRTEVIVEDLPRIQFWRSPKRPKSGD